MFKYNPKYPRISDSLAQAVEYDQRQSQVRMWQLETDRIARQQEQRMREQEFSLNKNKPITQDYSQTDWHKESANFGNAVQNAMNMRYGYALGGYKGMINFLNNLASNAGIRAHEAKQFYDNRMQGRSLLMVIGTVICKKLLKYALEYDLSKKPSAKEKASIMKSYEKSQKTLDKLANTPLTQKQAEKQKEFRLADQPEFKSSLPEIDIAKVDSRLAEANKQLEQEASLQAEK